MVEIKENIILKNTLNCSILIDLSYKTTKTKKPIVVFAHGFKGFKDWGHFPLIMQQFVQEDFAFLKFNFSHNGGTADQPIDFPDLEAFGNNNLSKEVADLNTVLDAIYEQTIFPDEEVDKNNIYVIGHSRGGGISLLTTQINKKIKKIATWASVCDFKQRLPTNLEQWKNDGVIYIENARTKQQMPMYYQFVEDLLANKNSLSIKNAVTKITIPQLIIHGTNDSTVSVHEAQQIKEWNPKSTLYLIEGSEHTFGGIHPFESENLPTHTLELLQVTMEFFKK